MSQHLSRPLLAALALFLALPLAARAAPAAAGPAAAEGPPAIMRLAAAEASRATPRDPRPFTAGAPLARRAGTAPSAQAPQTASQATRPLVFGYANAGNLGSGVGTSSWRFQDLSTVAFFGLHVNADGTLANDGGMSVWNSQDLTNLINAAHPYGVKVVVSIIQQDQGTLCSSLANAQTTVTQVINQINSKGVDGVNIDYEGSQATCGAAGDTMASRLDNLARLFRQQLPSGRNNLTIATYTSSAYYSGGFFDIPGLAPYVDQFFVMAYDLDNSNYSQPPLNCPSYCFSPVGPLAGYAWTDQRAVSTYTAVVPPAKVILGVPYYGWYACVGSPVANATPVNCPGTSSPSWVDPTILTAPNASTTDVTQFSTHNDPHDGSEQYWTWWSTGYGAWREMYITDPGSLGAKYDLVTSSGIAGAGLFALDYGGGDAGVWGAIEYHLTCPVGVAVPSSVTSTRFQVTLSAPAGCATSLDVQEQDQTLNEGWQDLATGVSPGSPTVTVDTYAGHTYAFRARAHDIYGRTDDWTAVAPTVAVPAGATAAHPFAGLYTADAFGGVHQVDSAPLPVTGYWPNWKIVHSLAQLPGGQPGGYTLDGWGGLHPNPMPPAATLSAYWKGWDIARGFVILPGGTGGYVVDGWGGLHPFAIGGAAMPAQPAATAYWKGWDIVRGIALVPGTSSGYVLDGWGGVHPFNGAPAVTGTAYWPGWDIARSIWVTAVSGQPEGYVLDGWGGVHPFNGIASPSIYAYWPGWDIARDLAGS
jgi:spore germination protein YaaH